jgi:hypothetical protein
MHISVQLHAAQTIVAVVAPRKVRGHHSESILQRLVRGLAAHIVVSDTVVHPLTRFPDHCAQIRRGEINPPFLLQVDVFHLASVHDVFVRESDKGTTREGTHIYIKPDKKL